MSTRTDSEAISIYGSPTIQAQPRIECLVDDRMTRSSEQVRELHWLSPLVDDEATHAVMVVA